MELLPNQSQRMKHPRIQRSCERDHSAKSINSFLSNGSLPERDRIPETPRRTVEQRGVVSRRCQRNARISNTTAALFRRIWSGLSVAKSVSVAGKEVANFRETKAGRINNEARYREFSTWLFVTEIGPVVMEPQLQLARLRPRFTAKPLWIWN